MVKKNRCRFPTTVLLTTVLPYVAPSAKSCYTWSWHWLPAENVHSCTCVCMYQARLGRAGEHLILKCTYHMRTATYMYYIFYFIVDWIVNDIEPFMRCVHVLTFWQCFLFVIGENWQLGFGMGQLSLSGNWSSLSDNRLRWTAWKLPTINLHVI